MVIRILILFFLSAMFFNCCAQGTPAKSSSAKCDTDILVITLEKIQHLSDDDIFSFLSTMDSTCNINVEFSEFSNELLYKILGRYPSRMMRSIESNMNFIQLETILDKLSSPLTDDIDLADLESKIDGVAVNRKLKERVLDALRIARNKIKE